MVELKMIKLSYSMNYVIMSHSYGKTFTAKFNLNSVSMECILNSDALKFTAMSHVV